MSPKHNLLPAHCTTASTRVLSKELSVKSFSSPSEPEEGPFTSSQGSPLRTVQLESENSFRQSDDNTAAFTHHLPPNGVCHTAFSTHVQSFDSTEQADRWNLHIAFARATDDTQRNTFTTLTTQSLPLPCAVLRQELAVAQLQLTNCEDWCEKQHAPLPSQSTSTSSPRCSSLLSDKFALCNSYSHSYFPIVSEKTTEQEQDNADSTQELLCHGHLQAESSNRISTHSTFASEVVTYTGCNPIWPLNATLHTGCNPVLPNHDSQHRHLQQDASKLTLHTTPAATGMDPVLPLHGMRVDSLDRLLQSESLPQSPNMTELSTGVSLTAALTAWDSNCDAVLPYPRDTTSPSAPESACSTCSPLLVFPHHTAEEPLGVDESAFPILRGALSSMTGTVHEWFKSAATSFHTWSLHAKSCWHSAAGFAETLPAHNTTTQTHRVSFMGMPTIGSPLPPQSESLNLTCGVSTTGMPINGNPLQSTSLTLESTSGYDYSICHLSSHPIPSLAVNAHHAIESQESIRATADDSSKERRLPILSADLATREVFANNLDIEKSLTSSRTTTNDHMSDTPSTYMSSDLATCEVFAHQLHQSTTLEWAKCTHDIEEDLTHPATLEDFALACTFYTTFNPSFHSSEPVDDDGCLPPILDTGATHCLLPLKWLSYEQAAFAKKIHLRVASGTSVRALLYNNLIYCKTVSRPLLSVGQLKAMLDLRLVWDDSAPCLLACSGGLRYVLLQASVVHHLPVVSHADLHVLLEAIHVFTETGVLWHARQWSQKLGRKLSLYHWGAPITSLPNEHADFTEDPQVNFTAMRSPLPTSSHLHSSTVTFEDLDEEEDRKERTLMTGAKSATTTTDVLHHRTLPNSSTPAHHSQDSSAKTTVHDSLSNSSSSTTSTTRQDKSATNDATVSHEQTLPTTSNQPGFTCDTSADVCHPDPLDESSLPLSLGHPQGFASTVVTTELDQDDLCHFSNDINVLLNHTLPKSRTRTNVVTTDYTPRGRLFGAYTTRGVGITHAAFRFPEVTQALISFASSRPRDFAQEPFLSAQLNAARSLPVHKDKNNHSMSWLIAFGDFSGGRLWIESPLGSHPPPNPTCDWQKKLRGDYIDVRNRWVSFDPSTYHAVEDVTSGTRRSLTLFSPKFWKKLSPQSLDDLGELGFFTPNSVQSAEASATALPLRHSTEVSSPSFEPSSANMPLPTSGSLHELSDCNSLPSTAQAMTLTIPSAEEQLELEKWCKDELVSLPWSDLPASDGSIAPLSQPELQELAEHVDSGHVQKSNLCRGCLEAEGPRRIHRTIRDIDKATHTLHIDIAGPLIVSDDGFAYFLVGALRMPGFPLLIDVRTLTGRTST